MRPRGALVAGMLLLVFMTGAEGEPAPAHAAERAPAARTPDVAPHPGALLRLDVAVVDDAGRAVSDLGGDDLVVLQAGVAQQIEAFEYDETAGLYRIEYRPQDGRLGQVEIRVNRAGAHVSGSGGPEGQPRWAGSARSSGGPAAEDGREPGDEGTAALQPGAADPSPETTSEPIRLGSRAPRKLKAAPAEYPLQAFLEKVTGDVEVEVLIDAHGRVADILRANGPELLMDAATRAVGRWRFEPTLRKGKPVPVIATVTVPFRMP